MGRCVVRLWGDKPTPAKLLLPINFVTGVFVFVCVLVSVCVARALARSSLSRSLLRVCACAFFKHECYAHTHTNSNTHMDRLVMHLAKLETSVYGRAGDTLQQ